MPVALGPVIKEPSFVALQIIFLSSAFFTLMGVAVFLTMQLTLSPSGTDGVPTAPMATLNLVLGGFPSAIIHLPASLAHGAVFGVCVAYCVERRRLCLDFALTTYVVFFIACCVHGGLPPSKLWYLAFLLSAVATLVVSRAITQRNEMQEVELTSVTSSRR